MSSIRSDNKVHEANCAVAESSHQAAIASATTTAACKAADAAFYRAVIASAKTNNLPYSQFLFALHTLGDDNGV